MDVERIADGDWPWQKNHTDAECVTEDQCPFCRKELNVCTGTDCLDMLDYMMRAGLDLERIQHVYAHRVMNRNL